jgi:membrane-associated protein
MTPPQVVKIDNSKKKWQSRVMGFLETAGDMLKHLDVYLKMGIDQMGPWIYILLASVVFLETGIVFLAFLPGDSLLFVTGALAGAGLLNIWLLIPLLFAAAVLGDALNYWLGKHYGTRIADRWLRPSQLEATRVYYEKHGPRTIILARFIPFIRAFAPFVAGLSRMNYPLFARYNIIGAGLWVVSLLLAGFFLGGIPLIKNNLEIAIYAVIAVSLAPALLEFISSRSKKNSSR